VPVGAGGSEHLEYGGRSIQNRGAWAHLPLARDERLPRYSVRLNCASAILNLRVRLRRAGVTRTAVLPRAGRKVGRATAFMITGTLDTSVGIACSYCNLLIPAGKRTARRRDAHCYEDGLSVVVALMRS
jgi:hypothetical protein